MGEVIRLDKMLVKDTSETVGPRNYHDRHGWKLESEISRLQQRLNEIKNYASSNGMQVNRSKSCILPFISSRKFDFQPLLSYNDQPLDIVYSAKLLGDMIKSTGQWNEHIEYVSKKARRRLFLLQRLKRLGASDATLKQIYILFIRSILEFAAPVWIGGVTANKKLTNKLAQVQAYACRIIQPNIPPDQTQADLGLQSLEQRCLVITKKLGTKMMRDPRFSHYFKKNERQSSRQYGQFLEPKWTKKRYGVSSIPFFVRLANQK